MKHDIDELRAYPINMKPPHVAIVQHLREAASAQLPFTLTAAQIEVLLQHLNDQRSNVEEERKARSADSVAQHDQKGYLDALLRDRPALHGWSPNGPDEF
jgi:hypothetical protein